LRATPTGPNRTTGPVQVAGSCGSQPVACHSTPRPASARCSTPPAGRALSFVGRPASRRDPISRERAWRQTLALRPRERRRATHRRRAPSMVSGVDGGRPSATENRLDLPLERCPVFWARRSRSPGMLTLTCYPPRYPRILGIAGFYRPTNGPAAKYSPWCPAPRQPRQNRVNPGCTAAWDIRFGLVSHEALT
jgi:hypothetical protein